MHISVVSPIFKTPEILPELIFRIERTLSEITDSFEIILVDDGCPFNSWSTIQKLANSFHYLKGVKLTRNFGQQIAVSAGLRYASGEIIIIMDGDLQNPPEAIKAIYDSLVYESYDIVYCQSNTRNHWKDELSSKLFWFLMNRIFKVGIIPDQLMMKGFIRSFVDKLNQYNERVRVIAGITHDIGMNYGIIHVENQKRTKGKSNYNFIKRFNLMQDIILATTNNPLNFLINFSLIAVFISSVLIFWNIINYFVYPTVPVGYISLLSFISFFGSSILLVLGVIGRYLSNIYTEVRNRPLFFIQETINLK
jgi:glycosyltransferase involved in cell wall biosynthesis